MTEPLFPPASTPRRAPRRRRILAGTLVVLSCILVPLSVAAIWVRNEILNTDRYVETVKPLASDPAIVASAAQRVTDELFAKVNVEKELKSALPKRAEFLAGPMTAALRSFAEDAAKKAIESQTFQDLWVRANRVAHDQVEAALTGGGRIISTKNGKVVLDLSGIMVTVRSFLSKKGIGIFDKVPIGKLALEYELFDAKQLEQAQSVVDLLNKVAWGLPVVSLVLFGVAMWLSPRRRRTISHWGLGTALAVAVLGAGITIGRSIYLDAVTSPSLPRDTAAAVFDTLVRFLRGGARAMIAVGFIVAFVAWITGPGRTAARLRTTFREVFGGLGDRAEAIGWDFGGFGRWVYRFRYALRVVGVAVALLSLVFADHVSATRLVVTTLLVLLYLGVIEFVARAALVPGEHEPVGPEP